MFFLVSAIAVISTCLACQPMNIHYQTSFCSSEVAAIVQVDSEQISAEEFVPNLSYTTTVYDIRKGPWMPPLTKVTVQTPGPANSCGPTRLKVGHVYMILGSKKAGNIINANIFNGAKQISSLPEYYAIQQKLNSYDCRCRVKSSMSWRPMTQSSPKEPNECIATSQFGCRWTDGACEVRNGECTYERKSGQIDGDNNTIPQKLSNTESNESKGLIKLYNNIVTLDWATMLTLVPFVAVIGFTWGCTPIIVHPQTTYCGSNVVAKIKIESLTNGYYALGRTRTTDSYFIYNGIILDVIKGTGLMSTQGNKTGESNNMKHVQVLTAAESSMCGPITLTVGETYLISGDSRDEGSVVASVYNGAIQLTNKEQYDELRRQMDLYKLLGCDCETETTTPAPLKYEGTNRRRQRQPAPLEYEGQTDGDNDTSPTEIRRANRRRQRHQPHGNTKDKQTETTTPAPLKYEGQTDGDNDTSPTEIRRTNRRRQRHQPH
ncbi:hypothetical protein FSP39_022464 [Pinctada imbricata]|uniref:NTR domain-containing protein n=1 Tax=Pinctada imbricata TaxID=66713 RepID=A0AA88Y9E7_PINIB|nr:hypothetical protein FSP39_022464 [Pinctada imbricata]